LLAAVFVEVDAGREAGSALAEDFVPGFASIFAPGFAAGAAGTVRAPLATALAGPCVVAVALGVACVEVFLARMGLPIGAGCLGVALRAAVISRGSSGVGDYTTIFWPSPSSLVAESRLMRARSPGARP
jgi:hypothetical protein